MELPPWLPVSAATSARNLLGGIPCSNRIASLAFAGGETLESKYLSNGVKLGETSRVQCTLTRTCGGIRLVYGNWSNGGETVPANAIKISVGVKLGERWFQVRFRGQLTAEIEKGGYIVSDVVPLDGAKGTVFYVHTYVTVKAEGEKWPLDLTTVAANTEGVTTTNLDKHKENVVASTSLCYSPINILAESPTLQVPVIAKIGDSIISGKASTPIDNGWFNMAVGANYGLVSLSKGGDNAKNFATNINSTEARLQSLDLATHGVVAYGVNDIETEHETAAELIANLEACYARLKDRGISKIIGVTITPHSSSTDEYKTLINQTVSPRLATFTAVNAWIRAGGGGYLSSYIDAAAAVEPVLASGLWIPNYTQEGTHPLLIAHEAISKQFNPEALIV